jgi:O-antigen/teichoic acid export membrane protein
LTKLAFVPTITQGEAPSAIGEQSLVRRLLVGTALSGAAVLISRCASVLLFLLLARLVTPRELGSISYALAVYAIAVVVADFGVSTSVPRFASANNRANALVVHALALRWVVSLSLAIGIWLADVAWVAFRGLGLEIGFLLVCSTFGVAPFILDASLRFREASLTRIVFGLGWLGGSLALVELGLGVWGPVLAFGLSMLLAGLPTLLESLRSYRDGFDWTLMNRLVGFGARAAATLAFTTLAAQAGVLVLAYARGDDAVAVYRMAFTLAGVPLLLAAAIGDPLTPLVARASRSDDADATRPLLHAVVAFLLATAGAILPLAVLFGDDVVRVLLPTHYIESTDLLVVLIAANALAMLNTTATSALYSLGEIRLLFRTTAGLASFALVATLLLLPPLGVLGAGLAQLAANLGVAFVLGKWFRTYLRGSLSAAVLVRPVAFAVLALASAALLSEASFVSRSAAGLVIVLVYVGLVLPIVRPAWSARTGWMTVRSMVGR